MSGNRRILVAKPGLDGHDRGAKYVAQILRDAGFEVIYTGIRRTPEQIVGAAIQEDVAAIGLSLLSGAHMELFARVQQLLRDGDAGDMILFGGGVIPEQDIAQLKMQGIREIFTPGTPAATIVQTIENLISSVKAPVDPLGAFRASSSDTQRVRAAARLMTALENEPAKIVSGIDGSRARLILGITGAPGSGKSTLTGALVKSFRRRRPMERVGVIAVDPSSSVTRGAILGDRVRIMHLADDPLVFIRSLATRGHLGGLSPGVGGVIAAMQLLACATIIVETVGVGQNEAQIAGVADFTLVVLSPGQGDDIQLLKAGVLEVADAIVVNKADDPNSSVIHQQVLAAQQMRNELNHKPVLVALVSAGNGQGVEALMDELDQITSKNAPAWQARRT